MGATAAAATLAPQDEAKLLRAADKGDVKAVEALLKAFVSVNARDEARQPARSQSPQRSRFFADAAPCPAPRLLASPPRADARRAPPPSSPQEGNTPLHNAANQGHCDVIRVLLQHGARLDARTEARAAPLTLFHLQRWRARVCARAEAQRCG